MNRGNGRKPAILVTGGAGYIGSVTVYALIEAGFSVVVLDSLIKGHREAVSDKAIFIKGDISTGGSKLIDLCHRENIEVAIHFAAFADAGESVRNPSIYYDNNVRRSIKFLESMRKAGVNKIVFSSSAAVYGIPENIPITENHIPSPINPYGRTKMIFELMLDDYDRAYGFKYVSLRYFNAAGCTERLGEDHNPETHLIPNVVQAAISGVPLKVYGRDYPTNDGTCVRDFIHVLDLASAHVLAVNYLIDGGKSEIFNLGTERGYSILEVIRTAEKVTGKDISYEFCERRSGDPPVLVASSARAKEILRWKGATHSLEQIIYSVWQWKLRFPNGYGKAERKEKIKLQ